MCLFIVLHGIPHKIWLISFLALFSASIAVVSFVCPPCRLHCLRLEPMLQLCSSILLLNLTLHPQHLPCTSHDSSIMIHLRGFLSISARLSVSFFLTIFKYIQGWKDHEKKQKWQGTAQEIETNFLCNKATYELCQLIFCVAVTCRRHLQNWSPLPLFFWSQSV